MQGIRPQQLTDEELVRYARLLTQLPPDWAAELLKRFEAKLDDNK